MCSSPFIFFPAYLTQIWTCLLYTSLAELNLTKEQVSELETLPYELLAKAYNRVAPRLKAAGEYVGCVPRPGKSYLGNPMNVDFREETADVPLMVGTVYGEFAFAPLIYDKRKMTRQDLSLIHIYGIRMLERLAERIRRPQVIFLTCHDNFSFAQKALRYDVSAYLLKPFRLDELSGALLGAVLKCRQKQEDAQIRKELADKQRLSETNQDYLVQNFILQLLNKTLKGSPETLAAAAERRKIPFDVSVRYYLLYVGVNMNNTCLLYTSRCV